MGLTLVQKRNAITKLKMSELVRAILGESLYQEVVGSYIDEFRLMGITLSTGRKYGMFPTLKHSLILFGYDHKTAYQLYRVDPDILESRVDKDYRMLTMKYHPDKTGGATAEIMKQINFAYDKIKNLMPRHRARFQDDMWSYMGNGYALI